MDELHVRLNILWLIKTKTKRIAEETLLQEKELKKVLEIVPVEEIKAEALQVKYPIIDWEIHTEGSRKYWKIIRVRNITEAYQVFEDMLKGFDREDLVTLWSLVKEIFRSEEPIEDKERALRVELKRLFEPDKDDVLRKLQIHMYDPLTWRLYGTCGVHHVSSTIGHNIYMLIEKDYPMSTAVINLMLSRRSNYEDLYKSLQTKKLKCEKLMSWSSKKQDCIVMSTAKAEYVSLSACCAQVIWMRIQLLDYGYKYNRILMYYDSNSAIAISCNSVQHSKTKHIDIRYYFIKEHVEKGIVGTEYQLADLFTNALPKERFEYLVHRIVIIMAQQQHAADVHPDELCPPNKRYDLIDANKKIDFEHEDGSRYRLMFMLDKKELSLTLDDFRTIFHLPQTTNNNHDSFMPPPSFLDMVPFYKNELGFTMELKTSSSFKTTGLLQPWQTLCKIFSKCLTTRVTGWDQPSLQIMQMMCCFINNIHVDYAELLWEGIHYSLHHPTSSISYPRSNKIIISHYMTNFHEISRRARDRYHNLKDADIMKNIFISRRYKDKVGMKILAWMISEEMKHTEHYQMYAEVFWIDVPLTQSQPTDSTQGTHRTPSATMSPNPNMDAGVSSSLKRSTMIHLQQEARENVELVNKHLASEEIEKMVKGPENVIDDSSIPRNNDQNIPSTRLEPRSDKESLEVEITNDKEVEITNVVIPVNINKEEEEITYEESRSTPFPTPIRSLRIHTDLARFLSRKSFDTLAGHLQEVMVESLPTMVDKHIKEQVKKQVHEQVPVQVLVYVAKELLFKRQQNKEETDKMIAKAMLQERGRLQAEISSHIQKAIDTNIPSLVDASVRNDPQLQQQDIAIWLALQMKFKILQVPQTTCKTPAVHPKDQDDPHDDAYPEGKNSAKRQKTSKYESFLQNILDLYFKHFKLSEDVVNRILQVILDLQHFKSSLLIFAATILQISSAIHHLSNIDNMYIKSYSFSLFSSLPAIHSGVVSPLASRKVHVHAINGFDMPLPVAICSGLVNPLAPRKGKFHGGLITMSTLCT
ncbi:hypothetical protein Tco_0599581 [Tanacetum coccineum]